MLFENGQSVQPWSAGIPQPDGFPDTPISDSIVRGRRLDEVPAEVAPPPAAKAKAAAQAPAAGPDETAGAAPAAKPADPPAAALDAPAAAK